MVMNNEKLSKAVDGLKRRLCCERPVAHYCRDICLEDPSMCDVAVAIEALETLQKLQEKTDIVEVVRCGQCCNADIRCEGLYCYCTLHEEYRTLDYFCASGGKKDEEDNDNAHIHL